MESNIPCKNLLLQVPSCIENIDDNKISRSSSTVSSNSSFNDDEWTSLTRISYEHDNNDTLSSVKNTDIIAQVYPNIVQVPWQDELIIESDTNNPLHVCLGISPSQFRRLIPSKRDAAQKLPRVAILYAQMAIEYTFEQIKQSKENSNSMSLVVLIVDAIQKYNFAAFNNKQLKTGTALKYALEEGDQLINIFKEARSQLSPEIAQRVTIIRWHDICTDNYNEYVNILQTHAINNKQFAEFVDAVVQIFIKVRKPNGHVTEEKRLILREYVLNELPALTRGIVYNNHHYPIIVHPILSSGDTKNNDQRNVMLCLLNYVRHSSELCNYLNLFEEEQICEVYDIAMPAFTPSISILTS
ncbi:unnamed protein product [Rotaria sordida]|uniref:Uncharacterized protein n=1 Tax=Rotaria sordida TaxID=392033 RepID=A0A815DVY4_9BILA|nr:unnamed protein product [Rotaria sordida]CAF1301891.1 unnamed protein product [Rotaria sordida]CAF3951582.1 unnamed protein product [Rotaria sordida]CAF3986669.1 unnamed protein product [Rotaria sordida]